MPESWMYIEDREFADVLGISLRERGIRDNSKDL